MSVIAQYQVSAAVPCVLNNVGTTGPNGPATNGWFFSNPPLSSWNSGQLGVNSGVQSSQTGQAPSPTSGGGQLQIYTQSGTPAGVTFVAGGTGEGKLLGQRFRIYMSGTASTTTGVPSTTFYILLNKGTTSSPIYIVLASAASAATVAPAGINWSLAADLVLDPATATIHGFLKSSFAQTGGGAASATPEAAITPVTGLVLANVQGQAGFGLAAGVSFSAGSTGNSASLYEFRIVED